MIVLNNVKKSYKSKKGGCHEALKGISLTLPSRGMVFLLGKSGSGKTTLLNIIGLLDTATEGTIEINGVRPQGKMLDDLRNEYSGFVFQEFALLEDETVEQNVRLALQLQNVRDTEGRVKRALEKVGLAGYEKRLPAELSGGEKQRVAIARAIVKDSEIILADEPTGNLDSENSDEIFDILKSISEEKLVLIVSHDRESAVKYADRIIEIKDGRIVSDSAAEVTEEEKRADAGIKSHLPTALALRMGWRNFGKKKIRSAMTFIIATLAITVLTFAEVFASFTAERAIAKTIVKNDLDYIELGQIKEDINDLSGTNAIVPFDEDSGYRSALEGFPYLEQLNGDMRAELPHAYIVEKKAQLDDMGLELYDGAVEITDESVYTTDHVIDMMRRATWDHADQGKPWYSVKEGDELVPIDAEQYNYQTLVGKTIFIRGQSGYLPVDTEIKLAGVVKTDKRDYRDSEGGWNYPRDREDAEYELFAQTISFRRRVIYDTIYCTRNFYLHHQAYYSSHDKEIDTLTFQGSAPSLCDKLYIYNNTLEPQNGWVLIRDSERLVHGADIALNADEIIIDAGLYNQLFDNEIKYNDFVSDVYDPEIKDSICTAKRYPEHLGDTVRLTYERKGKLIFDKTYTVVGVIMGTFYEQVDFRTVYFGNDGMAEYADATLRTDSILLNVQNLREGKIRRLLHTLRYDYGVRTRFAYMWAIYDNEPLQRILGYAFLIIGVVMILVTLLVVVSLISYNVIAQRKEIGILRALGARASDIAKIYLCQAGILSVTVFALSAALSAVFIFVINTLLANALIAGLVSVGYTPLSWLILTFGSFVALFLATSLPLRLISRQKPADAIKKG